MYTDIDSSQKQIGKLVFCEAREDNTTRLFVRRVNEYDDVTRKLGWWDRFTISTTPCSKGLWICQIKSFKIDRNEYEDMIVKPVLFYGNDFPREGFIWNQISDPVLYVLFHTYEFEMTDYHQFANDIPVGNLNLDELKKRYENYYNAALISSYNYKAPTYPSPLPPELYEERLFYQKWSMADPFFYREILKHLINGEITIDELRSVLKTPTQMQILVERIVNLDGELLEKYPLTMEKIRKDNVYRSDIEYFIFDRCMEYDHINEIHDEDPTIPIPDMEKVERVIRYRKKQSAESKAKKAAAKKAKKAKKKEK